MSYHRRGARHILPPRPGPVPEHGRDDGRDAQSRHRKLLLDVPMSTSSETLTRPDGSPVRVLVVDDEQMLADLLASALRYEG